MDRERTLTDPQTNSEIRETLTCSCIQMRCEKQICTSPSTHLIYPGALKPMTTTGNCVMVMGHRVMVGSMGKRGMGAEMAGPARVVREGPPAPSRYPGGQVFTARVSGRSTLAKDYDHVSEIRQPARFARRWRTW